MQATPAKHVVLTEFENGEGILVDLKTKRYYQLNETALLIWKELEKSRSLDEIAGSVVANYEVTPIKAKHCVEDLMKNLGEYKLIANFAVQQTGDY